MTRDIKRRVIAPLTARYSDKKLNELLLDVSSILDPRFKLDNVAEADRDKVKSRVKKEADEMKIEEYEERQDETEQPPRKKRSLGDFLKKRQTTENSSTATAEDRVSHEVDKYLSTPNQDSTTDTLEWWKVHAHEYPHLSKLAKHYLCLCARSSSSEQLFSTAGNVVTKKRSSLKPSKVEMLVFLAKNL